MTILLKKEIRLMLPAFGAAIILTALGGWLWSLNMWGAEMTGIALILLGMAILAVSAFGSEIGYRTMPLLLIQPVERIYIWWTKVIVLLTLGALCYGVVYLGLDYGPHFPGQPRSTGEELGGLLPLAIPVVAGGLYLTLLLRQVAAALLLGILIPCSGVLLLLGGASMFGMTYLITMAVYTVVCFFLARRKFLFLQDTGWTGGVVALELAVGSRALPEPQRKLDPWRALARKEFQLLQVTLLGMALVAAFHLGTVLLRAFGGNFVNHQIVSMLQLFGGFWLFIPLLAGSQVVADERQFGTFENLMSLPVSRAKQFWLKLGVVLGVGGILSPALLCGIEMLARAMGAGAQLETMHVEFHGGGLPPIFGIFLMLSLISFFASTLTRSLLPALSTSLGTCAAVYVIYKEIGLDFDDLGPRLWPAFSPVVVAGTLGWLAWRNYLHLSADSRRWQRCAITLGAVTACLFLTLATIYHRTWEYLEPWDDSHGTSVLTQGSTKLSVGEVAGRIAVLTQVASNSKFWSKSYYWNGESILPRRVRTLADMGLPNGDTNAKVLAQSRGEVAIIMMDGTLWWRLGADWTQVSPDANWKDLVSLENTGNFCVLNNDGTLWELHPFPRLAWQDALTQIGTNNDWNRISSGRFHLVAWKKSGEAWVRNWQDLNFLANRKMAPRHLDEFGRCPAFDAVTSLTEVGNSWGMLPICAAAVFSNRTLGFWDPRGAAPAALTQSSQSSVVGKWATVEGGRDGLVGVKEDGSLWIWSLHPRRFEVIDLSAVKPRQLGDRHDWVAAAWDGDVVALASDGELWRWPVTPPEEHRWLARSRFPTKFANVLADTK